MKKLMIGITILSIGLMAYGGYTSRRWSAPSATTDVNYAELAALIDANDLTDPNSHNAVTVTDSNSIDLTLDGQDITADVNETKITAIASALIRNTIEPYGAADANMATHLAAYDHNDIGSGADPNSHSAVTVVDSNSVTFTLTGQQITADVNTTYLDTLYGSALDINDTAYSDAYDGKTDEAMSANVVYDKFEEVVSGTVGFASSDSITFTIIDGNLVPDINDAWLDVNAPAGTGSGDANAVMAAHLAEFDHNDISAYHYYSFVITDPNSYYDSNSVFPIDCNIASALALLQARVTLDKNPATELDLDLKWANDVNLAGATLISALDTTAGKSTTTLTSSVAATKFFYLQFGARPSGDIDWMRFDLKCTTNDFDFKQAVIVEPNECYDVNAIFPVDYCFNASTISQIQFKCDINPTNEPNITLYYGDAQTGSGTKICDIDTTDGKATINSFDDATITAGSDIWGVWNEAPDADIKWEIIKIARTDDND